MSDDSQDPRRTDLEAWVRRIRPNRAWRFAPASADASFRRYFRARSDQQRYIVMDAPPEHEPLDAFMQVAGWLADWGVLAPRVHADEPDAGFLLLDDLGDTVLLDRVDAPEAIPLLEQAIDALVDLQVKAQASPRLQKLPAYDTDVLLREMRLFPEWFLQRHHGLDPSAKRRAALDQLMALVAAEVTAQPSGFVHRDYHSRNLMVADGRLVGMLDFQDAMHGPLCYDIVSLLRDCYVVWPEHVQRQGLERWSAGLTDAGVWSAVPRTVTRWFDFTGVQRHLKVLGIFCRLHHRDGKSNYLNDLPRVQQHLLDVCARYPELAPLGDMLSDFDVPTPVGGAL